MQCTANFHHHIAYPLFPHPDGLFERATTFDTAIDMCDAHPSARQCKGGPRLAWSCGWGPTGRTSWAVVPLPLKVVAQSLDTAARRIPQDPQGVPQDRE